MVIIIIIITIISSISSCSRSTLIIIGIITIIIIVTVIIVIKFGEGGVDRREIEGVELKRKRYPRRQDVTTSMVGIKNGHICKNLTQNGEPQRCSWGRQKKKKERKGEEKHY